MALGGVALVAVTVPFGIAPWTGFVGALRRVASQQQGGEAPIDKQATVLSFLQVLSGRTSTTVLIWLAWMAVSALLVGAALWAWRVSTGHPSALRVLGLGALLCVAANPRLYFYDALVLVLPAAGWYLDRSSYSSRYRRRVGGLCILAIVIASLLFYGTPWIGTLIGPASALWLLAEARDLRLRGRAEDVAGRAGVTVAGGAAGLTVAGPAVGATEAGPAARIGAVSAVVATPSGPVPVSSPVSAGAAELDAPEAERTQV
jgi:hypothetical protein